MKRRILILGLVCVLTITCSFSTTYAYLKADNKKVNTFIVGETKVDITEPSYTPPEELLAGLTVSKDPIVRNIASLDCYVRMRVDFSNSKAESICTLNDLDNINWELNENDGYYYYKEVLKSGEQTSELFKSVKISDDANQDDIAEFNISLYAEAQQAGEFNSYKEAWGLPQEG